MKIYQLDEVFGIGRDVPVNYIKRKHVDDKLIESLEKKQHIIIYGSSKQGKTCLRKKCIPSQNSITVHCSNKIDICALNQLILKAAGFEITSSHNKTIGGRFKAKASFGINFFTKINTEVEAEKNEETVENIEPLELDLEDTNDVIFALKSIKFDKLIILDDFHYLKSQTQIDFAFALKIFYEKSYYIFVIVGVWIEENRLIALNGDLSGRVISIDAEKWTEENLREVINKGEELLNIKFVNRLVENMIDESFNNVYLIQELCNRICRDHRIKKTLSDEYTIGALFTSSSIDFIESSMTTVDVPSLIKEIINQHTGRYNSFIMQFSHGFQNSEMETYKCLLYPILSVETDELFTGLKFNRIKEIIIHKYPNGKNLNPTRLSSALKELASIQLEKNITPNILDYDQSTQCLNVVDKSFLIWLSYQNKNELYELAGFNS